MFLKYSAATVLILTTGLTLAGQMGSEATKLIPSDQGIPLALGGGAIFLKPSINDMRDANQRTVTIITGQSSTWSRSIDYSWGFSLNASYYYTTNDDINLNWYHLRAPYSNTYQNLAGSLTTIDISPQWDAANLEFGKKILLDTHKNVRLHAGVQYARLSIGVVEINSASTVNGIELLLPNITLNGTPTYNGFGPRFGADFRHSWESGFSVYANTAIAILAGTAKYSKEVSYDIGTASVRNASSTLVVPELDAKLGAAYTHPLKTGWFTVDAGWMFFNYWNALNQEDVANLSAVQTTNFGAQGPYISAKWSGMGI